MKINVRIDKKLVVLIDDCVAIRTDITDKALSQIGALLSGCSVFEENDISLSFTCTTVSREGREAFLKLVTWVEFFKK